jgi:8-oxo-dGTP diphosphatase
MATDRHSVSVAATVVDDQGCILVIRRRDNGRWEIPGGILELDESITVGVTREVREETGIEITPERLTGVYKNIRLGVVALVFRGRVLGGQPGIGEETSAIEWWTPEQVSGRMEPVYAIRVLDALRAGAPAVRLHDGIRLLDQPRLES